MAARAFSRSLQRFAAREQGSKQVPATWLTTIVTPGLWRQQGLKRSLRWSHVNKAHAHILPPAHLSVRPSLRWSSPPCTNNPSAHPSVYPHGPDHPSVHWSTPPAYPSARHVCRPVQLALQSIGQIFPICLPPAGQSGLPVQPARPLVQPSHPSVWLLHSLVHRHQRLPS